MRHRRLGSYSAMLVVCLLFLFQARAQPRGPAESEAYGLEAGAFSVGFRLLEGADASRTVTAGRGSATHPRPLRVYVWYPAEQAAATMRFGRYAELAEADIWPAEIAGAASDKLAYANRPLARSLGADGFAAIASLLFTWGLAREAVPVIEFMGERYPSPRALGVLAEAYVLAGDTPAAIDVLTRFAEQYPDSASVLQRRIEALRAR